MKPAIFFLVLIFSFSACTDFQHMHYRKLKKVPAHGFVEMRSSVETNSETIEKPASSADPMKVNEQNSVNEKLTLPAQKIKDNRGYNLPVLKTKIRNSAIVKNITGRKALHFKKPVFHHKGDGAGFLIFLFLFLGIGLMVAGGWIFVAGFYALTWWLIVIGIVVFLLGILPFLGILSFIMVGDRAKPTKYYEEKK